MASSLTVLTLKVCCFGWDEIGLHHDAGADFRLARQRTEHMRAALSICPKPFVALEGLNRFFTFSTVSKLHFGFSQSLEEVILGT